MEATNTAIELHNVSKSFGPVRALDNVSVSFGEQRIYGLLGNNGAGKSTLMNLVTNRLFASAGRVSVDGLDVRNNDRALGRVFLAGEQDLYPDDMRVRRALEVSALFYPQFDAAQARELAAKFGLDLKKKISALSTGYASIFRLVVALSTHTPYLLLDEPVLGLDAKHRDLFYRTLMEDYAARPRTIVISTHLIAEVEHIIEHAVILYDGRVIKDAPVEQLLSEACQLSGPAAVMEQYLSGRVVLSQRRVGGLVTACVAGAAGELPPGVESSALSLQDYFISLIDKEEAAQ